MYIFLQVFIAWIYGYILEYSIHRWILHNKSKYTKWAYYNHFICHHGKCRKNNMIESKYNENKTILNFEIKFGIVLSIVHIPILILFPFSYIVLILSMVSYYYHHRSTHINVLTSRKNMSWHYDHHMGPNQNFNFGIRSDIIDRLLGTRKYYVGTKRERVEYIKRSLRNIK